VREKISFEILSRLFVSFANQTALVSHQISYGLLNRLATLKKKRGNFQMTCFTSDCANHKANYTIRYMWKWLLD
jgi:hypothetical protein